MMNVKRCLLPLAAGIAAVVCSANAQDNDMTAEQAQSSPPPSDYHVYHACEFSIDAYGVGVLDQYNLTHGTLQQKHFRWGGGAGVNFFLSKYVGIGGDAYSISWHGSFVDSASGNLILRLPIPAVRLAPYIFGGAGYQFEGVDQIIEDGGAGLEFRPVPHFGIFVDARYVVANKTPNYGLGRAGIRISF